MESRKLAILDDYFPNLKTGFRISEFNHYMDKFSNCEVYSTRYDMHHHEYSAVYPQFSNRVKPFIQFDWTGRSYSLYYTVFLSNAHSFYFVYELAKTPFVFELYPGGGFWINDPEIDAKLIKVLQSPLLKKVIVTQKITYDYILNRGFATPDKVAYIYGMVTHPQYFHTDMPKKYYGKDKSTFDICFVAHRYMPMGLDKGFHIFIDVCRKLSAAAQNIKFHVVGNFEKNEIYTGDIEDRITFYGLRDPSFFPGFYSGMDIIVSPNAPFILIPGKSYDGFPTGCCIDAGLHNVGVFCTDQLGQNTHFEHRKDIFIISLNAAEIAGNIMEYYHAPQRLYDMSRQGQARFREVFDFDKQLDGRTSILEQYM